MIKKLGRIVMLAIAITFITFSIFRIKDSLNLVNSITWQDVFSDWSKMGAFSDLGWGILYILVGLSALAVAISGHAGFWTFIASGLMLGFFIFGLVTAAKGGKTDTFVRNVTLDTIFQLIYAGGILLVMYGNHRENKAYKRYKNSQRE